MLCGKDKLCLQNSSNHRPAVALSLELSGLEINNTKKHPALLYILVSLLVKRDNLSGGVSFVEQNEHGYIMVRVSLRKK